MSSVRDYGGPSQPACWCAPGFLAFVLFSPATAFGQSAGVDGLTEPYRSINVAAPEPGIVTGVTVREGDAVRSGQVLATLDNDVHLSMLAIAQKSMEAQGGLQSALADLQLRKDRLAKFEELRAQAHARDEEVQRARSELAIAEAKLLAVQEELLIKKLEYDKIKVQLERRTIRSPIDGVVTKVAKDEGEFVAPNDPIILTVVQLDPLLATFSVPAPRAKTMQPGQKLRIRFSEDLRNATGTVEIVLPVTDAESGTVRVKLRIDNSNGAYRAGERCILDLPTETRGPR